MTFELTNSVVLRKCERCCLRTRPGRCPPVVAWPQCDSPETPGLPISSRLIHDTPSVRHNGDLCARAPEQVVNSKARCLPSRHTTRSLARLFPILSFVASKRSDVYLVLAVDQGWAETGCKRYPNLYAPLLDAIAAIGSHFDRFFAAPRITLACGARFLPVGIPVVSEYPSAIIQLIRNKSPLPRYYASIEPRHGPGPKL